jgi:alpha-1,3-rhamnosyl/mannosyltransferase
MRIGVNLLFMVPGDVGGSEPLLTNLVESVAAAGAGAHELTVFAPTGFAAAYPAIAQATELVEVDRVGRQAYRIPAEHTWLQLQARKRRLDVLHHGVGTTPYVKTTPTVVSIHDIQYRHHPENFSALKRTWLRLNVPQSARRSDVTAVLSRFCERDIVQAYGVDPARLVIVPFGSERLFGPEPTPAATTRERYHLERPYFFFPGRTYPHKNHRFLVEAFAPLAGEADLVFTGPSWVFDDQLQATIDGLGLSGTVRHLGKVPRADLAGLYEGAVALAYPSRFEGFGAPVLEAWSVGCPVVSSDAAALPEVVADAGVLLDPGRHDEWTAALGELLHDPARRAALAQRGVARAAGFTWERAARAQLHAYERAAGS